uniref:Putative ribonuclease H-like domain-containing protein n=1 Tax=Tanacetum cinerariifolium TaxID=118510 RepID=A0A6L2NKX9_TANCI|nr:putative ribonuclease H-like domain-containing protein [Tanacetum cinerariifolium]
MSSIEAEYIAAAKASMEAVWMMNFIDRLGGVMSLNKRPMEMLCDNEPALAIASDPRGNNAKSMTMDKDGNLKIRPPVTSKEHQQVQREEKARTILLFALPNEHMGDFYHMIDARDIWNAIKARFSGNADQGNLSYQESGNGGYGGYTTTLSASPGSLSSKDLNQMNKEEFEKYDLKHQMAMLSIKVHRFEKKHGWKVKFNGRENARFDKKLVKCFNCKQMGHFSRECRAQGGQNSNNYQKYKFKEARKDESDSKAMVVVDDADSEGEVVSADDVIPAGVFVLASTVAAAVVSPQSETEFTLMGFSTELAYEEKIKVLSYELEEKSNILEYKQKSIDQATQEKQELMTKLDNEIANQAKWNNSGNYMPPFNIPDIDESHMVYGKKATDSSKIKTTNDNITHTNDFVLFDFSDRPSEPSTNDLKMCDSSVECSRSNHSDHDSTSSVFAPASESRDTIVIDFYKQEDFPSVCSIKTDVKSSKPLCNKFGSFNKESHFRKHKSVASKSCYVCGSYLHLIKDCDFHEQTFAKRNAEGKVFAGQPNLVSAGQQNLVSAGPPNLVSARQQNTVSAGQLNLVSASHPNPVSSGDGILGNKDKLEDFEDFNGGEVTFGGSIGKISGKGTIKTKNLNFKNVLYVEELQHFNLIPVSQICDQAHRVLFTENECLVLFKDFPLPDPSMVILSIIRKHNLYTFSLNKLALKGPLTCLIAKASQDESTLWHMRLGYVNFRNMNKLVKGNFVRGSQEDDSDLDDEPYVLIIQSTPTLVVPIVDKPTTQNDGKEEADRLGLAFPSLNPILGVGTAFIGSSVFASSTPPVSAGSTPQTSLCASLISADRHSSVVGKSLVSAGKPTGSAGRPVSAGKPTGSASRPVSAGRPTSSAGRPVSAGRLSFSASRPTSSAGRPVSAGRSSIPAGHILGKIFDCPKSGIFTSSSYDEEFSGPNANNLESSLNVSSTITKRIHNIHPTSQVISDINSHVHTRSQVKHKGSSESAFISYIHDQRRNNHINFQLCMFCCFLSQEEPTTVAQALADPDWIEAMQEEMQQFRNQKVWVLVTLPNRKRAIGTKWILKNKRDARGIVCRNKARLVAQGHRQEEGIDYTDVFAPVARIEAIRLFLAFASFIGFMVYQIDVKSAFLYEKIAEEWFLFTSAGRVTFCRLFLIPAADLVSAGHILFLLGSPPPPSPVVTPHPSPDPMPSPPRQSSPPPIPFGHAPSSRVASTETIPNIPSSSKPSEPVLETIISPIRDDDTGGGYFHESPPSPPPATLTSSSIVGVAEEPLNLTSLLALFPTCLQRIATLEAELKATKILHRDTVELDALLDLANATLHEPSDSTTLSKPANQEQSSEQETSPTTLDAVLTLSQSKARARAAMIIYKRIKKKQSSSGLDFTDAAILAAGLDSASGLDSAGGVVSASGADFASGLTSTGISVAAGPTISAEPLSPIRDPAKGKAVATPSSPVTALTYKKLADQQAAILEAKRQELLEQELKQSLYAEQVYLDILLAQRANLTLSAKLLGADVLEDTFSVRMVELMNQQQNAIAEMKAKAKREMPMTTAQQKEFMRTFVKNQSSAIYTTSWTWKDVRGLTDNQLQIAYDKIRRAVDLAIAKDHHQHLKRSETTSVSAGATITAGDPIPAVTSIPAGSSIPAVTPSVTGVSTTTGASGSVNKASDATLRKPSRKKSIARRRSLPSAYKPKSDALSFDKDDPEAEFKRYLRQASDDDEPTNPVSLALMDLRTLITTREEHDPSIIWDDQDQWQIRSWRFYALPAIHILETKAGDIIYMFIDKKYPLTPETIQRMLHHDLEIDRDPAGLMSQMIVYDGFFCHLALRGTMGGLVLFTVWDLFQKVKNFHSAPTCFSKHND